jgi:ornithine cyclodeaminase/alanine dehydrogenase-like protein (mu-crystallin family)
VVTRRARLEDRQGIWAAHTRAIREICSRHYTQREIDAEVGEIFAGAKPSPVSETTVFKSVGIAVEDITAARLVFEAARPGPS